MILVKERRVSRKNSGRLKTIKTAKKNRMMIGDRKRIYLGIKRREIKIVKVVRKEKKKMKKNSLRRL